MKRLPLPLPWFKVVLITVMVLGLFFRFVNLDRKVYWKDEAYTSLRISGYTKAELIQQEFNGQLLRPSDLLKYQLPGPEHGVGDTISSLAQDAPQHSPLYFVLARGMVQLTGEPVVGPRLLSAMFSLLIFPALYWLSLELFEAPMVGWVAIALFAVSPFQVLYAQEARQYSLWAAIILGSTAALLRAMRLKTRNAWILYWATGVLGFYTYLFTALVTLAHNLYVLLMERGRIRKGVIAVAIASLASLIAYGPWIKVILDNSRRIEENTGWTEQELPLMSLVKLWARHYSYPFFDIQLGYDDPWVYGIPLVMLLIVYAAYFLIRHAPPRVWLLITTLALVTFLPLALPDVLLGGVRSITGRYLVPSFVAVQLAVAYLLGTQLTQATTPLGQRVWRGVVALVLTAGVVSCAVSAQADTWWTKSASYYDPEVARIVNQAERPLLISSDETNANILSLAYLLDDKVQLQLMTEPALPSIPDGFSDVFLYNVSGDYADLMEQQGYQLDRQVDSRPTKLWRLE